MHHGLRDLAPVDVDIALPRGARRPTGIDGVAQEALRRWVDCRGNSPAKLLAVAASFPKAEPSIRQALAVLR